MSYRRSTSALLTAALLVIVPGAARANSITENLSITLPSSATLASGKVLGFASAFDSKLGKLTSIQMSLTGPIITADPDGGSPLLNIEVTLDGNEGFTAAQDLGVGTLNLDLSATSTDPTVLTFWSIVPGNLSVNLEFLTTNDSPLDATFKAGDTGLTGTMTFNYTPVGVPGPIAGTGFPGLIFAGAGLLGWWRRKRNAVATTS
jgi:hypothetical protein